MYTCEAYLTCNGLAEPQGVAKDDADGGDAAAVDEPAPPSEDGFGEPGSEAADLDSLAN